jgi:hypothetical protein
MPQKFVQGGQLVIQFAEVRQSLPQAGSAEDFAEKFINPSCWALRVSSTRKPAKCSEQIKCP